jgi:hypothetical protein
MLIWRLSPCQLNVLEDDVNPIIHMVVLFFVAGICKQNFVPVTGQATSC